MAGIETLRQLGTMKKYSAHDYIFCEGDSGNEMYIVLSGKVGIYSSSSSDFPSKVSEVGPGGFFGEMSLLDNEPRSASVIAEQDTVVIAISRSRFLQFIASQPSMAYKIMKVLSTRIRTLNEELAELKAEIKKPEPSDKDENTQPDTASVAVGECPAHEGGSKPENSESERSKSESSELESSKSESSEPESSKPQSCESDCPSALEDILFPLNHKKYTAIAPDTDNSYLIEKEAKCPVCSAQFRAPIPRMSKLRLERIEHDFRKVYYDFEPLWYLIWVCPNCSYSNYYFDFDKISYKQIKQLSEKLAEIKGKVSADFSNPRKLDQVFNAYYTALYCAKSCNDKSLKIARLWLQLSWLYKDAGDEEMHKAAAMSALDLYYDAIYNQDLDISVEQEQQCFIILGELFLLKGDKNEALKHYHKAINRSSGKPMLNTQAMDRIQEIRRKP